MLNWADLTSLMMVVLGPLVWAAAAAGHHVGAIQVALFAAVGFLFGVCSAIVSSKIAYRVLNAEQSHPVAGLLAYALVPLLALFIVGLLPIFVTDSLYGPLPHH